MNQHRKILGALLRQSLPALLEKSFDSLNPGQTYIYEPYIGLLADRLDQVRRGKIPRLIINLPPRSLKSIAASVVLPAFILGHDPSARMICVSYSGDLAKKHANDFRSLIESPWYRQLFPATRIGQYKNSETEIETTKRGSRLTTSVGGTLTGRGADLIIIDDPLKPEDASSESKRNAVNQWYTNTLLSRLDDKRTGAIVLVMQRVHLDDLTGYVLANSNDWEVLSLPAIAEHDEAIRFGQNQVFRRQRGEVLSPEREPLEVLERMKRELGSYAFSAQYQQAPIPAGGAMIKRDWICRYDQLPPRSEWLNVVQSWDTASKGGPDNDWSVCTTWIYAKGERWYLADVWRQRVDYPTLKQAVVNLARRWQPHRVIIEDVGAGISLVQELRSVISGVVGSTPTADKVTRMAVVSAKFEAKQVWLPESTSWLPDLEAELFAFPGGRHDDQCDSISQALNQPTIIRWDLAGPKLMEEIRRTPPYRPPWLR